MLHDLGRSRILLTIIITSLLGTTIGAIHQFLPFAEATSTLIVPTNYQTIQAAINAASPGDTIRVQAGKYTEQIVINKDLTIIGSGVDSTIIKTPVTLTSNSFGKKVALEINNRAVVSITGLTIAGPGTGVCNSPNWGVAILGEATLDLSSSSVVHFRTQPTGKCTQFATAILVGLPPSTAGGQVGHATITDVVVSDYQTHGISVANKGSMATISHSTITGIGPTRIGIQNGILVAFGASATITQNIISNNLCNIAHGCGPDPISQGQSEAVFTTEASADTIISNNKVLNNDVGVYLYSSEGCCSMNNNEMKDNRYFGLIIQDGSNPATHNTIYGGQIGIGVVADSVDTTATLQNNVITGTSIKDVQEISCCGFDATASLDNG